MRNFSQIMMTLLAGSVLAVSAACIDAGAGERKGVEPPPTTSEPELAPRRTPVVVFPAFHFTKLQVRVNGQTVAPECPASGSFEDWFQNDSSDTTFSQECQDKLLTLIYKPFYSLERRFEDHPGVQVSIKDYGRTESAPFYENLYTFLEVNGYSRNRDIRVAGYDSRLTPDVGDFLKRTKYLIEGTYLANDNTPVHLVGHSNGPLYAQYLLTHTTQEWKNRYIHGFTAIAGNWPGQGLIYPVFFTGLNVRNLDFPTTSQNATSSARMYQSHPSSYMSAADPYVFEDQIVVVRDHSTGVEYTPADYETLFNRPGFGMPLGTISHYLGLVQFAPPFFPNVDVYAEKGSGLPTVVGATLPDLTIGRPLDTSAVITRDGDANQEDITNDAIAVWSEMPCFHFRLTDNAGVDHFALPKDLAVLKRLLEHLQMPKSECPTSP